VNKLLLALVGVFVFIGVIIAMAPATLLVVLAGDRIQIPGVNNFALNGTVWNASGQLQVRELPPLDFSWKLSPLSAATGTAATLLTVQSEGLNSQANGRFRHDGGEVRDLSVAVTGEFLNHLMRQYGLELSGDFDLEGVNVDFDQQWLTSLEGSLMWSGGRVHVQTPQDFYTAELPPLKATLNLAGDRIELPIVDAMTEEPLIDVQLRRDGWAAIAVRHAMLNLAGMPPPAGVSTEDPAILIEEQVLGTR
jgi:general secretion pathway protein N